MTDKLIQAVAHLVTQNRNLEKRLELLEQKGFAPALNGKDGKDGADGADGVSPSLEDIVAAVVSKLPEPEKIDIDAMVAEVLTKVPTPRDGRDAPHVSVADVASIVLAKIPKPADGKDGHSPDVEEIAALVRAEVRDGERGPPGPQGPPGKDGKDGKDGVSVTDVKVGKDNELYVYLDGKKRKVGVIKTQLKGFTPGGGGGASAPSTGPEIDTGVFLSGYEEQARYSDYTDQRTLITALDTPENFRYGPGGTNDPRGISTMTADGILIANKTGPALAKVEYNFLREGASGVSQIFINSEVSIDGGASWITLGDTFHVILDNSNDYQTIIQFVALIGVAGLRFRTRWARSSVVVAGADPNGPTTAGSNSGGPSTKWPSPALRALPTAFSPVPATKLVLYYDTNYEYT